MSRLFSRLPRAACVATLLLAAAASTPSFAQSTQDATAIPGAPVRVIPADAAMARMELARPSATDPLQAKLGEWLAQLTAGDRQRPVVFYCLSAEC